MKAIIAESKVTLVNQENWIQNGDYTLDLEFGQDWIPYAKTLLFKQNGKSVYRVPVSATSGSVRVPDAALSEKGSVQIACAGAIPGSADGRRTAYSSTILVLPTDSSHAQCKRKGGDEGFYTELMGRFGNMDDLPTDDKKSIVGAVSELYNTTYFLPHRTEKKRDYLCEVWYGDVGYETALNYFADASDAPGYGACTAVRKGNVVGCNLDWLYSDDMQYVIFTKPKNGRAETVGVASSLPKTLGPRMTEVLAPFYVTDAMNEYGLMCKCNVVPYLGINYDPTPGKFSWPALMVVRHIVDNFKSAREAVEYYVNNCEILWPTGLHEQGYELHWMIADNVNTYILESINGALVYKEVGPGRDPAVMTNFRNTTSVLNEDKTVYTPVTNTAEHNAVTDNLVEPTAEGLERFNEAVAALGTMGVEPTDMLGVMEGLFFSRAYNPENQLCSEFCGINGLTADMPASAFQQTLNKAAVKWGERNRKKPEVSHTMHTSVYDLETLTLYFIDQEQVQPVETYQLDRYGFSEIERLDARIDGVQEDLEDETGRLDNRIDSVELELSEKASESEVETLRGIVSHKAEEAQVTALESAMEYVMDELGDQEEAIQNLDNTKADRTEIPAVPVKGVRVAGTDLYPDSSGRVNIGRASSAGNGVVLLGGNGIITNAEGRLAINNASSYEVNNKTTQGAVLTPANINAVVRAGLIDNPAITSADIDDIHRVLQIEDGPGGDIEERVETLEQDVQDLNVDVAGLEEELGTKQDVISDLDTIRSGAADGPTARSEVAELAAEVLYGDIALEDGEVIPRGNGLDVRINGTSIVSGTVANVPMSSESDLGVIKCKAANGYTVNNVGEFQGIICTDSQYDSYLTERGFICKGTLNNTKETVVKRALTNTSQTAYTTAEKAAACQTIGAEPKHGTYELIETITLDSSTYSIYRNKDANGNTFRLKAMLTRIRMPVIDGAHLYYGFVFNKEATYSNAIMRYDYRKAAAVEFEVMKMNVYNGIIDINVAHVVPNTGEGGAFYGSASIEFADVITSYGFAAHSDGVAFPEGTIFEVYGVRE